MQSISFSPLEMQATREYWTAERIANATPAPLLGMKMPEGRQQRDDEFSPAETEMSFCAIDQKLKKLRANVEVMPFKTAGRLYYVSANGEILYATAQFVGANNIIMTAAHCLKHPDSGRKNEGWSSNLLFQRGYKNKKSIQDTGIVFQHISVPWNWGFGSGFHTVQWDYGFAKTVEPAPIFLNFAAKFKIGRVLTAIGYTDNHGNKKRYMCKMEGKKGRNANGAFAMHGNRMDNSASGGAWFGGSAGPKSLVIYGINAWIHDANTVYSPLFNQSTINLMTGLRDTDSSKVNSSSFLQQLNTMI